MQTDDFDFELPLEAIAQEPSPERDRARLFVHDIVADQTGHVEVRGLTELLGRGDLLVVNDTAVIPARLFARRATGGLLEVLLLEQRGAARHIYRWRPSQDQCHAVATWYRRHTGTCIPIRSRSIYSTPDRRRETRTRRRRS